jgi:hypothetical protein
VLHSKEFASTLKLLIQAACASYANGFIADIPYLDSGMRPLASITSYEHFFREHWHSAGPDCIF